MTNKELQEELKKYPDNAYTGFDKIIVFKEIKELTFDLMLSRNALFLKLSLVGEK